MDEIKSPLAVFMFLLLSTAWIGCAGSKASFDPVIQDPVEFDATHPPQIIETTFEVEGAGLNAIIYQAQGAGPHPTAVLLHGFPGNERNLDLAQAIRRAGWNAVFFHYRGSWGSGGEFSFLNVLEDVATVVSLISRPEFAQTHRIDPDRLALIGHSMGGFAALVSGAEIEAIDCVVSMAGANLGGLARAAGSSPDTAAGFAKSLDGWSGPIRGPGGIVLIEEIGENLDRFDTTRHAQALAERDLLLIAGGRDEVTPIAVHHTPLVEAIREASTSERNRPAVLETEIYANGDHSFSGQRIALTRRVTDWLVGRCAVDEGQAAGAP